MPVLDELRRDLAPIVTPDLDLVLLGIAAMAAQVERYSVDRSDAYGNDIAGWSLLFMPDDPAQTPDTLRWMAQLVGERVAVGAALADARAQVHAQPNKRRGHPDSIIYAAQATLTGARTVIMRERDATVTPGDPAYGLTIITYTAQTPSPAATLAAIKSMLPGGIVLVHTVLGGQDYQHVRDTRANYAALNSAYANYDAVRVAT